MSIMWSSVEIMIKCSMYERSRTFHFSNGGVEARMHKADRGFLDTRDGRKSVLTGTSFLADRYKSCEEDC